MGLRYEISTPITAFACLRGKSMPEVALKDFSKNKNPAPSEVEGRGFCAILWYKKFMLDTFAVFGAEYFWLLGPFLAFAYFLLQSRAKKKEFAVFIAVTLPLTYFIAKGIGFLYYN